MASIDLGPVIKRLRQRIGVQSQTLVREVQKGAIQKFARAIGETNPLFFDEDYAKTTRFGGIIAPPTYASTFATDHLPGEMFDFDVPLGRALHSDDIVENNRLIRVGDVVSSAARYAEVYEKVGREGPLLFQAADITLTDKVGALIAVVRMVAVSF